MEPKIYFSTSAIDAFNWFPPKMWTVLAIYYLIGHFRHFAEKHLLRHLPTNSFINPKWLDQGSRHRPDAEAGVEVLVAGVGAGRAAAELLLLLVLAVAGVVAAAARAVPPLTPPQLLHIHRVDLT